MFTPDLHVDRILCAAHVLPARDLREEAEDLLRILSLASARLPRDEHLPRYRRDLAEMRRRCARDGRTDCDEALRIISLYAWSTSA